MSEMERTAQLMEVPVRTSDGNVIGPEHGTIATLYRIDPPMLSDDGVACDFAAGMQTDNWADVYAADGTGRLIGFWDPLITCDSLKIAAGESTSVELEFARCGYTVIR
ncbi:hypothetical protein CH267_02040 [Rhodococcus sp. 06-621-2]|nr:hypothetical protein [Rhodococcus sp. 06-621-2]OZC62339.1 hypothetical protein CH267_02040 [Rhodococcus sp. 06-621-2]